MTSLEDAWQWYQTTERFLRLMGRLGRGYWDLLPWDHGLERDDRFRMLQGAEVATGIDGCLAHLNDLAVVVLFSVFESQVRQHILAEMKVEADALRHRALRQAAVEVRERIDEGSFFHILQPFKDEHADLVEQVNQVRRFRNWVAHGKRAAGPARITPVLAYDRLSAFLTILLGIPTNESA